MTIEQLRNFMLLANRLNYTEVAEMSFIDQSTLTRQIAALENELGIKLFNRSTRNVSITPAGKFFLGKVAPFIKTMDEALSITRQIWTSSGTLTLGFMTGISGLNWLPDVLLKFQKSYPNIKLGLMQLTPLPLLLKARNNDVDLIFGERNILRTGSHLEYQHMFYSPLCAVVYPGHALEERDSLSGEDLNDENLIAFLQLEFTEANNSLEVLQSGDEMDEILNQSSAIWTNSYEIALLLVKSKAGIALMPSCFEGLAEGLRFIPVSDIAEPREYVLAYNRHNPNPSIRLFLDMVKNCRIS